MCKLNPGPRCASHTHDALKKSVIKVKSTIDTVRAVSDEYNKVSLNPRSTNAETLAARASMGNALADLSAAEQSREEAQAAYDSTPTGQRDLLKKKEKASASGDTDEENALASRLEQAVLTRTTQMNAHQIISKGEQRLKKLDNELKGEIAESDSAVESADSVLEEVMPKLIDANRELYEATSRVDEAKALTDTAHADVDIAHQSIYAKVNQAYIDAGVSIKQAEHYAIDTLNSYRSGWEYLTDDSKDRLPNYIDAIVIKIKGFDHKDNVATASAAAALEDSPEFRELCAQASRAHAEYRLTLTALKGAKNAHKEADITMSEISATYEEDRDNSLALDRANYRLKANIASDMLETHTFDVNKEKFVSSAYKNADGTTNAYVLVKHSTRAPMYFRVTDVERDESGSYLRLETNDKVYASDLETFQLRLVTPLDGAVHLFRKD